jgi:hypothetical protein
LFSTSELDCAVVAVMFNDGLWVLFLKMFLGCEMEFQLFTTSELDCAVVTVMFDNGLWILFLKMFLGFDMYVVGTLKLTLYVTEVTVKCYLLHYFLYMISVS